MLVNIYEKQLISVSGWKIVIETRLIELAIHNYVILDDGNENAINHCALSALRHFSLKWSRRMILQMHWAHYIFVIAHLFLDDSPCIMLLYRTNGSEKHFRFSLELCLHSTTDIKFNEPE